MTAKIISTFEEAVAFLQGIKDPKEREEMLRLRAQSLADLFEEPAHEIEQDLRAALSRPHPQSPPSPGNPRPLREWLQEAWPRLERRAKGQELPIPLPWEHVSPQFGGGLWAGCHVLVGGTGSGKTQWALQVALHAAKQGIPSLYVALELGGLDLVSRLVALEAGLPWSSLYLGKLSERDLAKAFSASATLQNLPLFLEVGYPGAWPSQALQLSLAKVRQAQPQDPLGRPLRRDTPLLVVVDFLQLVGDSESSLGFREELRERIGRAAYEARKLALQQDAAVLLVSSTARQNYQKTQGELLDAGLAFDPQTHVGTLRNPSALIGLGKEAGEIEFAADSVTVLSRWPELLSGETSVIVATAKLRAGPARWSELRFDGSRFSPPGDRGAALRRALLGGFDPEPDPTNPPRRRSPKEFM